MSKAKAETDEEKATRVRAERAAYVDLLCAATMETDKGIKRLCEAAKKNDPDFPAARTVRDWIAEDEGFAAQYAHAKKYQLEHLAEQIIEISDDDSMDMAFKEDGTPYVNTEHIQRSKLRVDSRKWILSKLNPKQYGDKVTVGGDPDNPLVHDHKHDISDDMLAAIASGANG